jgi:SSS family solute:Na+ symporter
MLTNIDFGVIVLYAGLMAWIGILAKRKSSNVDEYFAAGHGLPWWMAAISHHVSGYSAVAFVGFAGRAAVAGFSMWTLFSLGVFVAMMIGTLIWAPRWSRLKVMTPVEYLEQRYGNSVRMLIAVSGIGLKFIDLGIKLFAISIVVHVVTGWAVLPIILVAGIITISYVFVGGLWATVLTDLVQFIVQLFMSLVVLYIALSMVGGWSSMWERLPAERSQFFNADAGISVEFWLVYLIVIILSYNGGTWGLAQRFIAVEKPREAQKAALLSGFLYLLYPIVIFLPAWAAPFLLPDQFDQVTMMPIEGFDLDQAYILVTQKILAGLAPGLIGLLVCSMFAATMSMIDSDINSLAAVFTKDIWQRNVNRDISDEGMMRVGMMATAAFGLAVIVAAVIVSLSPGMNKVFSFTVKLLGGLLSPIAIPLMFGMIYKKATSRGAILSFSGGMLTYLIATLVYDVAAFEVYAGLEILVCLVIYFGESLIASRSPEKDAEVEALFERLEAPRTE